MKKWVKSRWGKQHILLIDAHKVGTYLVFHLVYIFRVSNNESNVNFVFECIFFESRMTSIIYILCPYDCMMEKIQQKHKNIERNVDITEVDIFKKKFITEPVVDMDRICNAF